LVLGGQQGCAVDGNQVCEDRASQNQKRNPLKINSLEQFTPAVWRSVKSGDVNSFTLFAALRNPSRLMNKGAAMRCQFFRQTDLYGDLSGTPAPVWAAARR
jgi:hypothetical protein